MGNTLEKIPAKNKLSQSKVTVSKTRDQDPLLGSTISAGVKVRQERQTPSMSSIAPFEDLEEAEIEE